MLPSAQPETHRFFTAPAGVQATARTPSVCRNRRTGLRTSRTPTAIAITLIDSGLQYQQRGDHRAAAEWYERALQSYMYASGQMDYAFRVIDPPTLPDARERVFPQRTLFLALGLILGALLSVPVVLFRERRR